MKLDTNGTAVSMSFEKDVGFNNKHKKIIEFVSHSAHTMQLNFPECNMFHSDTLLTILKLYKSVVKTLILNGNTNYEDDVIHLNLASYFKRIQCLKIINSDLLVGFDNILVLHTRLQVLDLSSNRIQRSGFERIMKAVDFRYIIQNNVLRELILDRCHLRDEDIFYIKSCFPKIKQISLKSNKLLTTVSLDYITEYMSSRPMFSVLNEIDFSDCRFDKCDIANAFYHISFTRNLKIRLD